MRSGLAIFLPYGRYAGWLYLAAVLDLFSRRVVGWAMAATQDETLRAFTIAFDGTPHWAISVRSSTNN